MVSVYLTCFSIGGTLMVLQFLLSLLGFGHAHELSGHEVHELGGHDGDHEGGHEVNHDSAAAWFTSLLTFRTLTAALTFFGLGGLAAIARGFDDWALILAVALAAAVGALLLVGTLMRSLNRLRADGTVRITRAVGQNATVYLSIPGHQAGVGKVMVPVQNRLMEYQAVTSHEDLPTGAKVVVVRVINADTLEVTPATSSGV